jgi:predicted MFS family arabinose efflux permease
MVGKNRICVQVWAIYIIQLRQSDDHLFLLFSGFESMFFILGVDCGATFFGLLFHAIGVRSTLTLYAGMTAIMLAIFLCYLKFSKHVNEYEKLPVDSDDDVDNSNANDDNKHIK